MCVPSFRWLARSNNWNEDVRSKPIEDRVIDRDLGLVCIDADRCDALASRGGNPNISICPNCPQLEVCKAKGYKAQPQLAQEHRVVIVALQDLFTSGHLNNFYKTLIKSDIEEEDVIYSKSSAVIDEINPVELFTRCTTNYNQLQTWTEMWHGHSLGVFAQDIIDLLDDTSKHNIILNELQNICLLYTSPSPRD